MAEAIDYMAAKGWLKDAERKLLFELASHLPGNAVILNIGVEYGASLACLRAGNPTALIYGVDLDCSKALSDYDCELVELDSHEVVKFWDDSLDLIFVDGDHGKTGVLMDARFADHLPVGGHILFQDCWDWEDTSIVHRLCDGVNAAVDEWFAAHNREFEELPSVETTRVFKRVMEQGHEQQQQQQFTASGRADPDFQPGRTTEPEPAVSGSQSEVRRPGQNPGRRR